MWLAYKVEAQLISEGKQKKRLKNKHQSFWKHKKCFKWEAGDEDVISLWKK
jgi:hypothetical protein